MRKAEAVVAFGILAMLPNGGGRSSSSSSKLNGARSGNPNPRGCCTDAAAGSNEYDAGVVVLGNALGTWNAGKAGKAGAAVAGAIGVVMRMAIV